MAAIVASAPDSALLQQRVVQNQTRYQNINLKQTPPNQEECAWHQKTSGRQGIALVSAINSLFFSGAAYYSYFYMVALPTTIQYTFYATAAFSGGLALLAIIAFVIAKYFPSLNDPTERQKIRDQMDKETLKTLSYPAMRALYPRKDVLTDGEINALLSHDINALTYPDFTHKHFPSNVLDILDQPNKEILLEKLMEQIKVEIETEGKVENIFNKYNRVLLKLSTSDMIATLKDRFQYEQLRDFAFVEGGSCGAFLQSKGVGVLGGFKTKAEKASFANKLSEEIRRANLGILQIERDEIYGPALNNHFDADTKQALFSQVIARDTSLVQDEQMSYATFRANNGLEAIQSNLKQKETFLSAFLKLDCSLMIQDGYATDRAFLFGDEATAKGRIGHKLLEFLFNLETRIPLPKWINAAINKGFIKPENIRAWCLKDVLKVGLISSATQDAALFELGIITPETTGVLVALEKQIQGFRHFTTLWQGCPRVLFAKKFLTKQSPSLTQLVSTHVLNNLSTFIGLARSESMSNELIERHALMNDTLAAKIAEWKALVEGQKTTLTQAYKEAQTLGAQAKERYDQALKQPAITLTSAKQAVNQLENDVAAKRASYQKNQEKLEGLKEQGASIRLELNKLGHKTAKSPSSPDLPAQQAEIEQQLKIAQQQLEQAKATLQELVKNEELFSQKSEALRKAKEEIPRLNLATSKEKELRAALQLIETTPVQGMEKSNQAAAKTKLLLQELALLITKKETLTQLEKDVPLLEKEIPELQTKIQERNKTALQRGHDALAQATQELQQKLHVVQLENRLQNLQKEIETLSESLVTDEAVLTQLSLQQADQIRQLPGLSAELKKQTLQENATIKQAITQIQTDFAAQIQASNKAFEQQLLTKIEEFDPGFQGHLPQIVPQEPFDSTFLSWLKNLDRS